MTKTYFDWRGNMFEAPNDARTCFDGTGKWRTHYLFAPENPSPIQALTTCGLRAGEIPGETWVNCPDCLQRCWYAEVYRDRWEADLPYLMGPFRTEDEASTFVEATKPEGYRIDRGADLVALGEDLECAIRPENWQPEGSQS